MGKLSDKKVFVTGGLGLIGSHLVERILEEEPKEVLVLDIAANKSKHRLSGLQSNKVSIIYGNIMHSKMLLNCLKDCDIVLHCAADTNMQSIGKNKNNDVNNGLLGTINLLESMKEMNVEKLVYLSSSAVYGELAFESVKECEGPLFPISTYGAAKLGAEGWVSAYSHLYDIKALIFRLGNIVGSKMDHGLIFDLVNKLHVDKEKISILGNGRQGRTYLHVKNCADKMIKVVELLDFDKSCDLYNLSGEGVITTLDAIEIAKKLIGIDDLEIIHENKNQGWKGDVSVVNINCEKLSKLGIEITSSRDEIEQAIADAYNEVLEREKDK